MAFKSYLRPEGSIFAGVAVVGAVYAIYQLNLGSTVQVGMTDANHPQTESARKKAGYSAAIMVAGVGLIAKDANILILGSSAIIVMELTYRHSIMSHPETGMMQPPDESTYAPAGAAVSSMYEQEASGVSY
jgi:hypothetical protein